MSTPELERSRAPHRGLTRQARRARRVLERDYERLRASTRTAVERKLGRVGVRADPADVDPAYNLAWQSLYAKLAAGEQIENPAGFLTQATFFRMVDEHRGRRGDRRDDVDPATLAAPGRDPADRLDDERRLRELAEGMQARLGERERRAAVLCYLHGYTRDEAAAALGIGASRMQKVMDRASKVVREVVADVQGGAWCTSQRSLVTAYALGVLEEGGPRHTLAREHLDACPGCRARVRALRGLGAVVPPIALPWGALGLHAAQLPALAGGAASLTTGGGVSASAAAASTTGSGPGVASAAGSGPGVGSAAAPGPGAGGGSGAASGSTGPASGVGLAAVGTALAAAGLAVAAVVAVAAGVLSAGGGGPAGPAATSGPAAPAVAPAGVPRTAAPAVAGASRSALGGGPALRPTSAGPVASGGGTSNAQDPAGAPTDRADVPQTADPTERAERSPDGPSPRDEPASESPAPTPTGPPASPAPATSSPEAATSSPEPAPTDPSPAPARRIEIDVPGILGAGITLGIDLDPVLRLGP